MNSDLNPETNPEVNPEAASGPSGAKVIGYCRACGKALSEANARTAGGTIYCSEHVPATEAHTAPPYHSPASPYANSPYAGPSGGMQPPPLPGSPAGQGGSPPLAFLLGMIPGVGAVYNGQYAKGLVHVIIVGVLISILDSGSAREFTPLVGMFMACFWFYMAFEAFHTARKRRLGQPLDEFSSILPAGSRASRFPVGPVLLIGIGVLFLLNNLDLLDIHKAARYWPAVLIVYGAYLLYERVSGDESRSSSVDPLSTGAATQDAEAGSSSVTAAERRPL